MDGKPIDPIQAMFDGWSEQGKRERAATQLTLGDLIADLEAMPQKAKVANLCNPGSYRGYYSDLYFEQKDGTVTAGSLLKVCKEAMGKVFEGYKGGDFMMGELTPLWISTYGCCGLKLMKVHVGGKIDTAKDE